MLSRCAFVRITTIARDHSTERNRGSWIAHIVLEFCIIFVFWIVWFLKSSQSNYHASIPYDVSLGVCWGMTIMLYILRIFTACIRRMGEGNVVFMIRIDHKWMWNYDWNTSCKIHWFIDTSIYTITMACNVLCWSYWWMATAISLEGVVLQLNSCSVGA